MDNTEFYHHPDNFTDSELEKMRKKFFIQRKMPYAFFGFGAFGSFAIDVLIFNGRYFKRRPAFLALPGLACGVMGGYLSYSVQPMLLEHEIDQ